MIYSQFDFKHGRTILEQHFPEISEEIRALLGSFNHELGRRVIPTASSVLQSVFEQFSWTKEHQVTPDAPHLKYDLAKGKVVVEIQLNDASDCYNDYLKFLLGYNLGRVEVGVEIVYDDTMMGERFNNVPKIGKVQSDLTIYRRVLPCPMWVIGLTSSNKATYLNDIV